MEIVRRSMEANISVLLGKYDTQTDKPTEDGGEVSLPIRQKNISIERISSHPYTYMADRSH